MRLSDGLFLECAREVADEYPFIRFDEKPIDNVCLELAMDPTKFDVLVMENLFGDVISDLCAGPRRRAGRGAGGEPGCSRYAVFEAVHGSAPDIAGKGLANPVAVIRSAAMMLDHVGERAAAARIEAAVISTLQDADGLTRDLGGSGHHRHDHRRGRPPPQPGGCLMRKVVLIQGGGVGLDQEAATREVLNAAGVEVEFQAFPAGRAALEAGETEAIPQAALDAVKHAGVALKTKLLQPKGAGMPTAHGPTVPNNYNVEFRRRLGLFASVRPVHNLAGLPSRFTGVNFHLVREITEDLYAASEHEIVPGVVQSLQDRHRGGEPAVLPLHVRAGLPARQEVGPLHPQGEHPEARRRPVPRLLPPRRRRLPGDRGEGNDRRQHLHATRVEAAPVRGAGRRQPVRRPALRPRRGPGRRHQRDLGDQRRRRPEGVRGCLRRDPRGRPPRPRPTRCR